MAANITLLYEQNKQISTDINMNIYILHTIIK